MNFEYRGIPFWFDFNEFLFNENNKVAESLCVQISTYKNICSVLKLTKICRPAFHFFLKYPLQLSRSQ